MESGDERSERGRSAAAIIGGIVGVVLVVIAVVLIIGGLVAVGLFVLLAVGLNQWRGSNK